MLDYLADLESDFSAVHRVADVYAMDGPVFFRLAHRMAAYRGVMRMHAEADAARRETPPGAAVPARPGPPRRVADAELRHSEEFAGIVDWGRG